MAVLPAICDGRQQGDRDHDRRGADEAGQGDEDGAVEDDVRRAAALLLLVEQFEQLPLHAGAAEGHRQLDHGDGDGEGAEQGDAEQAAGDDDEEQPRAEADDEAQSGRAAASQDQSLGGGGGHFVLVSVPDGG